MENAAENSRNEALGAEETAKAVTLRGQGAWHVFEDRERAGKR